MQTEVSNKGCRHQRGDWIREQSYWLCADCFEKLSERPRKYGIEDFRIDCGDRGPINAPRQILVWQAEVAEANDVTLNDFLKTMTRRFIQRSRFQMSKDDAYELAISVLQSLKSLGDSYGDPSYDWSHDGAREMADEEMSYWETDSDSNT